VLDDRNATYDRVTGALLDHPWAHFACHGESDFEHPSMSHLLLADHLDHPFTVLDVARLRLDHADLAFLSACSTARTGAALADEAIHLAAAFQLAGYRHVVATLWPVGDRWALKVAQGVYSALGTDASNTAAALHRATRRLRAILPDRPSSWAAHLYNGA
jgi:CHAT domain-containing protein